MIYKVNYAHIAYTQRVTPTICQINEIIDNRTFKCCWQLAQLANKTGNRLKQLNEMPTTNNLSQKKTCKNVQNAVTKKQKPKQNTNVGINKQQANKKERKG